MPFTSFILITMLHNAMRKFGTFFALPGISIRYGSVAIVIIIH